MKDMMKRWIYLGISISFILLAARRTWGEDATEGENDTPSPGAQEEDRTLPVRAATLGRPLSRALASPQSAASQPVPWKRTDPLPPPRRKQYVSPDVTPSGSVSGVTVSLTGRIMRNGNRFALRESAGAIYPLYSTSLAWRWEGEDVRVTGMLDSATRLLRIEGIQPVVAEAGTLIKVGKTIPQQAQTHAQTMAQRYSRP